MWARAQQHHLGGPQQGESTHFCTFARLFPWRAAPLPLQIPTTSTVSSSLHLPGQLAQLVLKLSRGQRHLSVCVKMQAPGPAPGSKGWKPRNLPFRWLVLVLPIQAEFRQTLGNHDLDNKLHAPFIKGNNHSTTPQYHYKDLDQAWPP